MRQILTMRANSLTYPRLCALIAEKPSKLSQAMHNGGFKSLNLDFNYIAVDTLDTKAAIDAMRALGFRGYSLTIPHKEKALKLVDDLSFEATKIGAINTVINDGERLYGYNTDCYGISKAISESSFALKDSKALVLGAGGAAKAAVYQLLEEGASKVYLANRSFDRANEVAKHFSVDILEFSEVNNSFLERIDLLVNATPIGSHLVPDSTLYPFNLEDLPKDLLVFDTVTKETDLILKAKAQGLRTIEGSRMLLHQALKQFEYFTDLSAPISVLEEALNKELT